jgi:hypothetical protein
MNCTTLPLCCLGKFRISGVLIGALLVGLTQTATAQTCLQNEYNQVQHQNLNCTAGDVKIAKVTNIRDPITGATKTTCFAGSTFNFIADFEIVTTSSRERENVGLYIANNSTTQALTGTCDDNIISPPHQCPGAAAGILCGSDNYHQDPAIAPPDNCGDTSSNDNSATFGSGAERVTLEIDNFKCEAPAGSSTLVLPNCTSWQEPGGNIQCVSNSPGFAYPFNGPGGTPTAIPGAPSKCHCDVISLPITPVTASAIVQKACTTTLTPGPAKFTQNPNTQSPVTCDAGPEGSTVTYTVSITNTSNSGGLVVDQICDSAYGTIIDNSNGKLSACPAGTSGISATNGNCPPGTIAAGGTATCTFSAVVGENLAGLVDTVTANGHSDQNTSSLFTQGSNSVTVTSSDAPSTATVTKGVDSTTAACATVRYNVDVKNTSGADENLSLTGLSDSVFGDLTKCTNTGCTNTGGTLILGTTCGVASNLAGLGTLSGSNGAGSFSSSLPVGGADYTCKFDAQFCSGLDNNKCISNTDKITPSLSGDEAGDKVTVTANTLNVKECLTTTVTSQ